MTKGHFVASQDSQVLLGEITLQEAVSSEEKITENSQNLLKQIQLSFVVASYPPQGGGTDFNFSGVPDHWAAWVICRQMPRKRSV